MKNSIYNYVVSIGDNKVIFNTVSNSFLKITPAIEDCLLGNHADSEVHKRLVRDGFIVPDNIDEKKVIKSLIQQRKLSSKIYQLIINTSLDCNLGCWYCYETHVPHSFMKQDMAERVIKHIRLKQKSDKFEILQITFFGGEPLMNIKAISYILNEIRKISEEEKFDIQVSFITNGTLITQRLIDIVKPFKTIFQITIDGNKDVHDKTRKYKKTTNTSCYETIINNLKELNKAEGQFFFNLRINYDQEILENIDELIKDLSFIDRKRCTVSIQKIWQCGREDINMSTLYAAINKINANSFVVSSNALQPQYCACYADNNNEAVINFDGKVFKCTARNFMDIPHYGILNEMGVIEWNTDMVMKRLSITQDGRCDDCILLPSCGGICSQHRLEGNANNVKACKYDERLTIENIISMAIKQRIISFKLQQTD